MRGGPSSEYEVSLASGATVLKNLPEKYKGLDIFISKDGEWHFQGLAKKPENILRGVDVVFNAMHGEFGEDGKVQQILDSIKIPYTGSGAFSSAVGMNKILSKEKFAAHSIKTPRHITLEFGKADYPKILEIFKTFPQPSVVKPANLGSSVGVSIAKSITSLEEAIARAFEISPSVIIEEFIKGKEATCGVLENFRGEDIYSLLPVEIVKPSGREIFDYDSKYSGETKEICPGHFGLEEKEELCRLAAKAHRALGLRHYSRSDFIVSPRRGIYILEVNSLPGLTQNSLLPKSLEAVGCGLPEFLDHIISLALSGR